VEPRAVARIAHSIERCGQIVPCVVVAVSAGPDVGGERLVLIDGYRRGAALRRLGRVEQWTCDLTDALLGPCPSTANQGDLPFKTLFQNQLESNWFEDALIQEIQHRLPGVPHPYNYGRARF